MVSNAQSLKRTISAFGMVVAASLLISVCGAASASATVQHWYSCTAGASGFKYSDPGCTLASEKGTYAWQKLTASKGFSMKGTTSFTMKFSLASVPYTVTCSEQWDEGGNISNPAGGGAGSLSLSNFNLIGCSLVQEPGCKAIVSTMNLAGEATELSGKPALKFSVPGSTTIMEISFVNSAEGNCDTLILGPKKISGSFTGTSNSATSSLEFTAAGSNMLLGGNKVTLEGSSKIGTSSTELGAGEALKIAP